MQPSQLLESLAIGVSIAAIPGPVFVELTRRTLAEGFASGAWLAAGELLGNLLTLLSALVLSSLVASSPARLALSFLGAVVLVWIGIGAWINAEGTSSKRSRDLEHRRSPALTGFLLAICSPITIAIWSSLSISYLQPLHSPLAVLSNGFLITFGLLVLFIPLAALIHHGRGKLPMAFSGVLSKAFAIVLIAYGISFASPLEKLVVPLL